MSSQTNPDPSLWTSIQHLKKKLRTDRQQLQEIKNDLVRGKSNNKANSSHVLTESNQDEESKENRSSRANQSILRESTQYRRENCPVKHQESLTGKGNNSLEILALKKQHKNQIRSLSHKYSAEIKALQEEYEDSIRNIRESYQKIIQEKNDYIQMLETSLNRDNSVLRAEDSQDSEMIGDLKEYYNAQILALKQKYETIIETLTDQKQTLLRQCSIRMPEGYNLTFKDLHPQQQNQQQPQLPQAQKQAMAFVRLAQSQDDILTPQNHNRDSSSTVEVAPYDNPQMNQSQISSVKSRMGNMVRSKFRFKKNLEDSNNNGSSCRSSRVGSARSSVILSSMSDSSSHLERSWTDHNQELVTPRQYSVSICKEGFINRLQQALDDTRYKKQRPFKEIAEEEEWADCQIGSSEEILMRSIKSLRTSLTN